MTSVAIRVLTILLVLCFSEAKSYQRTFVSYSNFDSERWSGTKQGLPCAGDSVRFLPDKAVSVFVQTNFTITEMIFPADGEFVFGNEVVWGVDQSLSSCQNEEHDQRVVTYDSSPDDWFDVKNWKTHFEGELLDIQDTLDIEKVPCEFDVVTFPKKNSWTVTIPQDIDINSISIWEKFYTTNQFTDYRKSSSGRYQFAGVGNVAATNGVCQDRTGCACRSKTNTQAVEKWICSQIRCSDVMCDNTISPVGQCCPACGALLTFKYDNTYTEASMKNYLFQLLPEYNGCHITLSKITPIMVNRKKQNIYQAQTFTAFEDFVQIFVTDEETGTKTGSVAKDYAKRVFNDLTSNSYQLGANNVTLSISGEGIVPQSGLSPGAIAGIVIGVVALTLLFAITVIAYNKRYSPQKRGLYTEYKDEVEHLDNPGYDMSLDEKPTGLSKGEHSLDSSVAGLPGMGALTNNFGMTFGNPLYSEEDV